MSRVGVGFSEFILIRRKELMNMYELAWLGQRDNTWFGLVLVWLAPPPSPAQSDANPEFCFRFQLRNEWMVISGAEKRSGSGAKSSLNEESEAE